MIAIFAIHTPEFVVCGYDLQGVFGLHQADTSHAHVARAVSLYHTKHTHVLSY